MRLATVGILVASVMFLVVGCGVYYETQIACNGCQDTQWANDLDIENQRSVQVTVDVTVTQNGSVVATASETVGPRNETSLVDLVEYGEYRLVVEQGNRTLRTDWRAESCYGTTVEVTDEYLEERVAVC